MASRGYLRSLTPLWLALGSCTHERAVVEEPDDDVPPSAGPVVVEHDTSTTGRWLDIDIAQHEESRSVGCAVDAVGGLWCWGDDPTSLAELRPQLGPGPSRVEAVASARAVAVSPDEICRVDADGRAYCLRSKDRQWRLIEEVADAERIVVTELGACALQSDRRLQCWNTGSKARTLASDVVDVTMDRANGCLLRADGEIQCWDHRWHEEWGEEGDPRSLGRIPNAIDIALDDHLWLLVLDAEGKVVADEVDDGEVEWLERSKLPNAVELVASPDHVCARTASGLVQCYGLNDYGQLGGGDSNRTEALVTMALGEGQAAREIAVSERRTCVRTADNILCVGLDASAWQPPPGAVHQHTLELDAVAVAAHGYTSCALDRAGDLHCWGGDYYLQPDLGIRAIASPTARARGGKSLLGVFTTDDVLYWIDDGRLEATWIGSTSRARRFVEPMPQPQILAFAADRYVCAIEASARGPVTTCGGIEKRKQIPGIDGPTALVVANAQVCAIDRRARVVCSSVYLAWKPVPSVIAGVQNARSIAAMRGVGDTKMCAALESGRVLCWDGEINQIEDQREEYIATPATDVGLTDVVSLVGTDDSFCSLDRAGKVSCWSPESSGAEPVPGPTIDAEAVQLAAGRAHACALDRSGAVTCWGNEEFGQLGRVPAAVSLQPKALVFDP